MELGDKKTELVHFGDQKPKSMTGRVVYIHPQRRFYVVAFDVGGHEIRESYYFPARRGDEG